MAHPPSRHRLLLALVLASAFIVRLPLITESRTLDTRIFVRWARLANEGGLAHVYAAPGVNYGPVSVLLLAGAARVEAWLPFSWRTGDRALIALIKFFPIASDVLTAALIATLVRRWKPDRPDLGVWAAFLYAFNPGIWYTSAYWGQLDSIYTLLLVAAVAALMDGRLPIAWGLYVLSLAVKIVGVSLAPLIVAWSLVRNGVRATLSGFAVAGAVALTVCAPWLIAGRIDELLLRAFVNPLAEPPRIVVSAYNLWYLLLTGRVHQVSSQIGLGGLPISYQTAGVAAFAAFAAAIVTMAVRRSPTPIAPAAVLSLGIFTLSTQMHERHMFPALPFVLLAAARCIDRSSAGPDRIGTWSQTSAPWWDYGLLSATFFFNLYTIAPVAPALYGNLVAATADTPLLKTLKVLSLVAAGLNTIVLARLTRRVALTRG